MHDYETIPFNSFSFTIKPVCLIFVIVFFTRSSLLLFYDIIKYVS
jgi:hypothetical protein